VKLLVAAGLVTPRSICSAQDRQGLIEFPKSLTDDAVLHDPRFANSW
jgi:hypothetical protein